MIFNRLTFEAAVDLAIEAGRIYSAKQRVFKSDWGWTWEYAPIDFREGARFEIDGTTMIRRGGVWHCTNCATPHTDEQVMVDIRGGEGVLIQ